MKKHLLLLLASLWIGCTGAACRAVDVPEPTPSEQDNPDDGEKKEDDDDPAPQKDVIHGYGDLHIFRNINGRSIRVVAAKADGGVLDTLIVELSDKLRFGYRSAGDGVKVNFEFGLRDALEQPRTPEQEQPEKTLAVSDLHGRLDAFAAVLKGNKVIDRELNWIFGENRLIVLGDMMDRGRDDNGIAWLVYKLEKQAEEAGGCLDFITGNHEDLVMKDDLRFINEAHDAFWRKAGIPYAQLYGTGTELGRWLRGRHLISTGGENIFVHAGLSIPLVEGRYSIGEINDLGLHYTGIPNKERNAMNPRNEVLFGTGGVIWYRGLVKEDAGAISSADLDKVLEFYGMERIIVGHSEVAEVELRYGGRVVAINVKHANNYPAGRTAGILIEGDDIYSVTYSGVKKSLTSPNSRLSEN